MERVSPVQQNPLIRPWIGILGLALLLLPALLRAGFALDDRELLFGNPATNGSLGLLEIFRRDYFQHLGDSGQWRPLASLSLRWDRALFGDWATGYHLTNGLLHLGVAVCAASLLRQLRVQPLKIYLGLMVFSLHPALADSVVWIAGRTSMLSALFPLGGLWLSMIFARRDQRFLSLSAGAMGLLMGLLAKEDAILFVLLWPILLSTRSRRQGLEATLASGLVLITWCLGRQWALGAPFPSASSPALGSAPLLERLIVGGQAWVEALRLALWPVDYPPQYRREFLLARTAGLGPSALIAGLAWLAASVPLVRLLRPKHRNINGLAAAFCVLSFLPVTQLVPSGELFAPRFLYLPLLFAIPLIGAVLEPLARRPPGLILALGLALLLSAGLFGRAAVYADQGAWRATMLEHHPDDVPSWNAIGLWREDQGDQQGALDAWQYAIQLDSEYSRSWSNLGRVQMKRGDLRAAEISLRAALVAGPNNPIPRVNLATLLARQGLHVESAGLYLRATQLSAGLGPAWRGLGSALSHLNRHEEARQALERALQLNPRDRAAQTLLERLPKR